jgi:hypothetical protein
MKKILNYLSIALILLLGVVHVVLTPLFYKTFDLSSLWFAGTGLSFVFLGIINVSRVNTKNKSIKVIGLLANSLALILCILIVMKLRQPQAYIGLFVLALLFLLSLIDLLSPNK